MSQVLLSENILSDVADSIRLKTGTSKAYKPSEFSTAIENIEQEYTPPSKGLVFNSYDYAGRIIKASVIGVTSISDYWFSSVFRSSTIFNNMTELSLPNNLTSLGRNSFHSCDIIKTLNLTNTLKTIGDYCFYNCSNINFNNLPESITSIGSYAFNGCSKLSITSLPPNITVIKENCFYNCYKLNLEYLPENLKTIEKEAFYQCTALPLNTLPNGVTTIGSKAFYYCTNLSLTKLPNNLTTIGDYAFYYCSKLNIHELPESITSIGSYAFNGCSNIAINKIPKSITRLLQHTFRECKLLEEIKFMGNISVIDTYCFYNCTNLKKLEMPYITSVPTLGSSALSGTSLSAQKEGKILVPQVLVDAFKTKHSTYAAIVYPILPESIEIANKNINEVNNVTEIVIKFNEGISKEMMDDLGQCTITCSDNATIDGYMLTLNEGVQVGDVVTVTATSTYNPEITTTKELEVVHIEQSITIDLNDGQWVYSEETIVGNVVYKSDAGSYHINNGKSIARIHLHNINKITLYIKASSEYNLDYTEAFEINTDAVRSKGKFTTKGINNSYVQCTYTVPHEECYIDVMYSKDSSANNNDDRGYFYIENYE